MNTSRMLFSMAALTLAVGVLTGTAPAMADTAAQPVPDRAVTGAFAPGGVFRQTPGTHPRVVNGHIINYSPSWSGYAVIGGTFHTTTAEWTQTAVSCPGGSQFSSPWVGIDGYSSNTVEQTGSEGDCLSGRPSYYAWYEMWPRNTVVIHHPVHPGDHFTGTVTHTGGSDYKLALADTTQGWSVSFNQSISAKNNSAEAVMERDGNNQTKLADFGTTPFTSFTVDGKPVGSFSSPFNIVQMFMKVSGTLCESTSGLSNSEDFTVTWKAQC